MAGEGSGRPEVAGDLVETGHEVDSAFYLQQSIEKALKAYLLDSEGEYPFSHKLQVLDQEVGLPDRFTELLQDLDTVYSASRYPDTADAEIEDIEEKLDETEKVVKWIERQLN